ncbi:MAG TPA: NAD(P)/FAD-dependent oxidoreductase [Polyangiaceae bacterium]
MRPWDRKEDIFDCVIVGARCAGAPLATHLSRAGMKICLLDQDRIPSDQPFSTHAISPLGMEYLDELGVGEKVRGSCPKVSTNRIQVGSSRADLVLSEGREMYCPRRSTLDPLLAEAAVGAGADLRDETAVLGLIRDREANGATARVNGVRARHAGKTYEIRARHVIGADGRNSTIAKLVRAEEYHVTETPRGGYWAYYPVTPSFAALPFQTYIEIRGPASRFAFRTDGDLVLAGALDTIEAARTWTRDIERHVHASLQKSEVLGPLVEGNRPVSRFRGLLRGKFFFRTPVGPGWALVGDAGLHKDPTPGYGITDALRDAKALSLALVNGRDAALDVYWRRRDVQSVPLYANASAMGSLDYDNPFNRIVIGKLGSDPGFAGTLRAILERELSPFEAIPAWRVLAWAGSALLRGRTEILPHFVQDAKRGTWVTKETRYRQGLLDDAERRLA